MSVHSTQGLHVSKEPAILSSGLWPKSPRTVRSTKTPDGYISTYLSGWSPKGAARRSATLSGSNVQTANTACDSTGRRCMPGQRSDPATSPMYRSRVRDSYITIQTLARSPNSAARRSTTHSRSNVHMRMLPMIDQARVQPRGDPKAVPDFPARAGQLQIHPDIQMVPQYGSEEGYNTLWTGPTASECEL